MLYVNADSVLQLVLDRVSTSRRRGDLRAVVCDLSASPYIDLAGSRMLHQLHGELASRNIALRIVGARGRVRDLLRADGFGEKVGGLARVTTLDSLLSSLSTPAERVPIVELNRVTGRYPAAQSAECPDSSQCR